MGRQSRRRRSELRRLRLREIARRVPDQHRPLVPPDAHARRSARAAGREAGTAAPGAGGSDRRTVRTDAALRPRERYPARPDDPQRTAHHDPIRRADRRIARALDARAGDVVVGLDRRGTARRRLHLARRGRDPNGSIQRDRARRGRCGPAGPDSKRSRHSSAAAADDAPAPRRLHPAVPAVAGSPPAIRPALGPRDQA